MLQGFRTYKERRNLSYNEEFMTRRSLATEPTRHREDVNSEFMIELLLALVI